MKLTEKQKNCPYCHGEKDLINTLHYEYPHRLGKQLGQVIHVEGNRLVCEEDTTETVKIGYCPMCGRSLTNEGN